MNSLSTVMIIDDHALFRAGIKALLGAYDEFDVVGEACDGFEGMQMVTRLEPDLIISDLSMPNINGTEAIISIKKRSPNTKVLVLTVHKAEEYIHNSLQAGADGYMLKDDTQQELIAAIRQVLLNNKYLSPSICNNIVSGYLSNTANNLNACPSWQTLTSREIQVLKLVAEGNKNKDIAAMLSISQKTVEKHRSNFMSKLDLHDVSSITTYALKNGLVLAN
jgi:DNA-binding NarL/FixJ family response regulator